MKIIFKPGQNGDKEKNFKKPKEHPDFPHKEPLQGEQLEKENTEKSAMTEEKPVEKQVEKEEQQMVNSQYPGYPDYPGEHPSYPDYPDYCPGCPEYPEYPSCPDYPEYPEHPGYPEDPCDDSKYKCGPYPYPGYYYPLQCLGYAYIPWQRYWRKYPPAEAHDKGTLFPELYSPYFPDRKPPVVPIPYLNRRQPMLRKKKR